jgi:hypothetical protein
MNRLCWELERWDKGIRWKRTFPDFDYSIMLDESVEYTEETARAVEDVYLEFGKETRRIYLEQSRIRKYQDKDIKEQYTRAQARNYRADWKRHYDLYRNKCKVACPDEKALANILVRLGYEKYPKRDKRFMWNMAGDGIVANIKQVENLTLPKRDVNGEYKYLGRSYSWVEIGSDEVIVEDEDWIDKSNFGN